jgi:hypothetical protein
MVTGDPDITEPMNAISHAGRVDQTLTRLRLCRDVGVRDFLQAFSPSSKTTSPVPEQDLTSVLGPTFIR